ncbi:hypothetical protein [Sphingobium sp. TCM1]|uniref:hypothetical protein n=1 Tax=Sphingobium sp. TCM1 TaxID=453246 RepID=UPI000B288FF2|nr:hypothetical protein [Sphingobium sp. TCM1]
MSALEDQRARLKDEISRLRATGQKDLAKLEATINAARKKYDAALDRWRADS